ncbi:hypothetical protein HK100_010823 [Physocladia obscura]|uniref:N-acetyltransferase domain-containing protein n=1 Tax=Physocladia obscura TaxID=109957 RepID=A0AAD5XH03_9FUNG|nr:hypothetical protein HK100_010823 [Physocladia obscura]
MHFQDLYDHYDKDLTDRFYSELMIPAFGMFPDELESVSVIHERLSGGNKDPDSSYILHVILALDGDGASEQEQKILGGVCCEYYVDSNCGLLTYIVRDAQASQKGIGKSLVNKVVETLNKEAVSHGFDRTDAIFLETNTDQVDASLDVMEPRKRRAVLFALHFRFLDYAYVQPRLSDLQQPCESLYLCVHESSVKEGGFLPAKIVSKFMVNFYSVLQNPESVNSDPFALKQLNWLAEHDLVKVHPHCL